MIDTASRQRLRALVIKESLQIMRDPSSIAIAFILPIVLLFLFGYGVSLDAKDIPVGIVVEQPDAATQSLSGSFEQSDYFTPSYFHSIQRAEQALTEGKIQGIVWLKSNFARYLLSYSPVSGTQAVIAVRVNGVDSNQANLTLGYIQGVWLTWLTQFSQARGVEMALPVQMEHRVWFNPAVSSRLFLVPGLVAIIMTLIGSLLTAMVVAREWDRGTMEALMVTSLRNVEFIAGKLIPYFFLGMASLVVTVFLSMVIFSVPYTGSFWLLLLTGALFMLVSLAIGLLISIVSKSQFVAGQVAIIVSFLPAFILSGFIFDINSMPLPIQLITHIVPARYFVAILQTLFLAGDIWPVILANVAALLILLLIFSLLVAKNTRKRLE
ncbi:MAG: ABC transporter permease [Gammaproteobacteria bacterium]|nr:ABC transporter permease [Gammaproteobacteria bacterium]